MKRKKIGMLLAVAVTAAAAAGCGSADTAGGRGAGNQTSVEDVLQAGIAKAEADEGTGADQNAGTGAGEGTDQKAGAGVDQNAASAEDGQRQIGPDSNAPKPVEEAGADSTLSTTEGVDVDLTTMSTTMIYSEVYNMLCESDKYEGKKIRMEGDFSIFYDEATGNTYYSCIIQDATACCSQGLEFVLKDSYSYPEDYPKDGEEITVTGVFETYMEGEDRYCRLRDAELG